MIEIVNRYDRMTVAEQGAEFDRQYTSFKTRTIKELVQLGRMLAATKNKIPYGEFLLWLEARGIEERTAQNWMLAAKKTEIVPDWLDYTLTALLRSGRPRPVKVVAGSREPSSAQPSPNEKNALVRADPPAEPKPVTVQTLRTDLRKAERHRNEQAKHILKLEDKVKLLEDVGEVQTVNERTESLSEALLKLETKCRKLENEIVEMEAEIHHLRELLSERDEQIASLRKQKAERP